MILDLITDNHRYLQKRSTLLQNNDDCLNAIKTLIGLIGKIDKICIFFLTNKIIIKMYHNLSQSVFFFIELLRSMTLLRNFLNVAHARYSYYNNVQLWSAWSWSTMHCLLFPFEVYLDSLKLRFHLNGSGTELQNCIHTEEIL